MSKAMLSDPITPSPRVEFITSVQRRRRWSSGDEVRTRHALLARVGALPRSYQQHMTILSS
jgi:hypothetical protein